MLIIRDLTFAVRNLRRNKLLAAINVFGLSIGISACLAIFLIASYELDFDRFQPDKDRVYRIYSKFSNSSSHSTNPGVPTALAIAVHDHFTGIESITNFHTLSVQVKVPATNSDTKVFGVHNKIIIAGPEYFDVFNYYNWLAGDPKQSLDEPFKVVLTESRAKIYFGDADLLNVIGKQVLYQDSLLVTVSGIVKDIQQRTDFDFTDFISFSTVERSWLEGTKLQLNIWNAVNNSSQLFIKLAEGTSAGKIEDQLLKLPELYEAKNGKWDDWRPMGKMQPLKDVHFDADLGIFDNSRSVMDKSTLYILIGVAGLLFIIAVINFINLETAQASRKAKEVGIRKVLGSSRRKVILRFLSESFILCVLAVMVSVVWIKLSFNYFHDYIPAGLTFRLGDPLVTIFLLASIVSVTFLAGLYPALVVSSYQPALALKNLAYSNASTSRSAWIRKGLTIFQFSFSQIFIVGALVIGLQLHYLVNKDLGFNPDAVVFVNTPSKGSKEQRSVLKNELAQIPEIEAFGMHGTAPVSGVSFSQGMRFDNGKEILEHEVRMKEGDTSYLHVYNLKLLAGRNFLPIDSMGQLIINETYLHLLGFTDAKDAIGKAIARRSSIVGVVKDFHTRSLHATIEPTAISYRSDEKGFGIRLFAQNNQVADLKPGLSKIEAAWKAIYPDEKFNYSFMSDRIKRYYENEERTGKLAAAATVIAILISCLGLFGLSSFTVVQRTKEIGIRKVLGATVNSIMILLSKEFLLLVAMAFILSTPFAYYISDWWLQDFAFQIDLNAWIFVSAGLFSVIIAFLTISFRTVSAANEDPIKSLKYE